MSAFAYSVNSGVCDCFNAAGFGKAKQHNLMYLDDMPLRMQHHHLIQCFIYSVCAIKRIQILIAFKLTDMKYLSSTLSKPIIFHQQSRERTLSPKATIVASEFVN